MSYIHFGTKDLPKANLDEIIDLYQEGFVATRTAKGHYEKVRSIRINLSLFELSSENRRILRKYPHVLNLRSLPLPNYSWTIHKMGKDFYDQKFGKDIFSANKINEIFNQPDCNNFNSVLEYLDHGSNNIDGYCIAFEASSANTKIVHYSYPFYRVELINSSFGIFMMTKAIEYFKNKGYAYIYLGSAHTSESRYKLQFKGIEWYDEINNSWNQNIEELKRRITK